MHGWWRQSQWSYHPRCTLGVPQREALADGYDSSLPIQFSMTVWAMAAALSENKARWPLFSSTPAVSSHPLRARRIRLHPLTYGMVWYGIIPQLMDRARLLGFFVCSGMLGWPASYIAVDSASTRDTTQPRCSCSLLIAPLHCPSMVDLKRLSSQSLYTTHANPNATGSVAAWAHRRSCQVEEPTPVTFSILSTLPSRLGMIPLVWYWWGTRSGTDMYWLVPIWH